MGRSLKRAGEFHCDGSNRVKAVAKVEGKEACEIKCDKCGRQKCRCVHPGAPDCRQRSVPTDTDETAPCDPAAGVSSDEEGSGLEEDDDDTESDSGLNEDRDDPGASQESASDSESLSEDENAALSGLETSSESGSASSPAEN